jgi:predicted O-methyltransferase YrrM
MVIIENKSYKVNDDEFNNLVHVEFNNLKLISELNIYERIIGLIRKCSNINVNNSSENQSDFRFFSFNTSHGGFIPINLIPYFNDIYILNTKEIHIQNIIENNSNFKNNKIKFTFLDSDKHNFIDIIYIENLEEETELINYLNQINSNKWIIICNYKFYIDDCSILNLSDTNIYIYINNNLKDNFNKSFHYYVDEKEDKLNFNNLTNLCIMVKNGGPQFEQMLIDNLPIIDEWTILDTGSTDDTIDIIKRVLVGKKYGNLYEEPFINFRDSRNRLIELAGDECKYKLMLDDTYIIKGDLRSFLNEVRSDQYSTSFTLFILSDDTKYGSNRIIKSNSDLRYIHKIHEVISDKNNINVVIPEHVAHIDDRRFDYMEKRTMERKQLDLKLLYEELNDDPNNPRTYYYLAQTYNLLGDYEKTYFYFMKRCEFKNSGFLQERVDAAFEAARIANFKLNYPWEQCEKLYLDAFKIDETRPESLYFIGIHYYLDNNYKKAYEFFKKGFEIGFPIHCQYSLKPTLSFHFLPKFLTRVCYQMQDYLLGEKVSHFFLLNNDNNADDYQEIISWHKIYQKLNIYNGPKNPVITENDIFCFVADGGFNPWTGSNILTTGVGGSETYIIEIARYIKKNSNFDVYVFCNTPEETDEIFEGVHYKHLNSYYTFINTYYIKHCMISRFSEYLPVTFKGFTENVYFVIHDLTPSGNVIPIDLKLKNIFCLTEWHVEYFTSIFSTLKNITVPFYYGIDNTFKNDNQTSKYKHKFIYSSFPNRGLLQLLQMWPKIYQKYNTATLHIYSDIHHKWSNDVEPEKMLLIKNLLNEYNYKENGLGIYYHGWVHKKELANAWATADIWFYPCTFMETFCLTALEAASSKTLCVTNDLAALQNTVGSRGVIIKGDPTTEEWKQRALEQLFYIMDDENYAHKHNLINDNYNWSKTLSWETQATKFLEKYIYRNNIFEYKGMYNWTHDLPLGSKDIFLRVISYFNNNYHKIKFGKQVSILEIGTYTGTSLIELIKLIPNSTGIAIDRWSNYNESDLLNVMDNYNVKQSFYKNIKNAGLQDKIQGIQLDSTTALIQFIKDNKTTDFIYVDGSHLLLDCYSDLVLSWQILEKGGILAIDDYLYKNDETNILNSPYEAVNHFLKIFNGKYKMLDVGYRVFLEKI